MSVRPITDTLRLLQGGVFLDVCSEKLAEAVKSVDETGKAGKVTITLDLKRAAGAISISAKVTNKVPEAKADDDLMWPTVEGNLSLDNPNQQKLDLRQVETQPLREIKSIEPGSGEIRFAGGTAPV